MYQWYIQGTQGAPPEESKFFVEADGPDPNDPTYVPTWAIRTLRHINSSTQYRSILTLTQVVNGVVTEVASDTRLPGTSRDFNVANGNYFLSDDTYGYRFGWVDRHNWQTVNTRR